MKNTQLSVLWHLIIYNYVNMLPLQVSVNKNSENKQLCHYSKSIRNIGGPNLVFDIEGPWSQKG